MDLTYYREREKQERAFADQARSEIARAAHLELAERYRAVIDAHQRLEEVTATDQTTAA